MATGILQLNQQQGDQAQALDDNSLERDARRQISNIQAKMEAQDAAWNLGGRAVGAGIQTYKDYKKGQKKDPNQPGKPDDGARPGYDDKGEFHPIKDFVSNFANPNSKYDNLRKAMRGQQQTADPTPVQPAASDQSQTTATASPHDEQKTPLSAINHENAPVVGSIIARMLPAQPSLGVE